jgi:hypothetical protein
MELSKEILAEIEDQASLFMTPDKIAIVIDIPFPQFKDMLLDPKHPAARAFRRGSLKSEIELRRSVIDLANRGSSPAQTLAVKLRDEFVASLANNYIE